MPQHGRARRHRAPETSRLQKKKCCALLLRAQAAELTDAGAGGWSPAAGEPVFQGSEVQAGKTRSVRWVDGGDGSAATGRDAHLNVGTMENVTFCGSQQLGNKEESLEGAGRLLEEYMGPLPGR